MFTYVSYLAEAAQKANKSHAVSWPGFRLWETETKEEKQELKSKGFQMWVQPSLGVLPFIWENEEDNLCCLHPFKRGKKRQETCVEERKCCCQGAGRAVILTSPQNIWQLWGNTVWTSGNRRLNCRSSILSAFSCYALLYAVWDFQVYHTCSSVRGSALLFIFLSDMNGALGFIGVFLSFLSGECVVFLSQLQMPAWADGHVKEHVNFKWKKKKKMSLPFCLLIIIIIIQKWS